MTAFVTHIWKKIGYFLKCDITWKTIVLGYFHEINEKTTLLNNLISFVSLYIYKYKMKCRLQTEEMLEQDLLYKLKNEFLIQNMIVANIGKNKNDLYKNVGNCL